jgi:predicted tellurium resistance membrane protein TerC
MDWIFSPEAWIALVTLTVLEIVLGIDNIVFITILADRLPEERQSPARRIGLALAMGTRILLLLTLAWVMGLIQPLFSIAGHAFSGRDLILAGGGLFLLWKATIEIHDKLEGDEEGGRRTGVAVTLLGVVTQIALLDIVFSLDSVITAIGMAEHLAVMILAIVIAVGVMMLSADAIGHFVSRHPTVRMLALSFLLLIGMSLVAEGMGLHIPKGYIYFAMGFSVFVEMLNLRIRTSRRGPVRLRAPTNVHTGWRL